VLHAERFEAILKLRNRRNFWRGPDAAPLRSACFDFLAVTLQAGANDHSPLPRTA
jgi:hypothetical protein